MIFQSGDAEERRLAGRDVPGMRRERDQRAQCARVQHCREYGEHRAAGVRARAIAQHAPPEEERGAEEASVLQHM